MKSEKSLSFKTAAIAAGAFISYTIGAGFASGNEVLQFFGSWGGASIWSVVGGALTTLIFCVCLFMVGQRVSFEKTSDSYTYFGGKVLGWVYQIFVFLFVLGCFMLMFSGAGSLLNQFWGLDQWVGATAMAVVSAVVVLGGLKTVENVLGSAGILILAYVVIFGIVSLFNPISSFEQAAGAAEAVADGRIWQANLFELPPLGWIPGLAGFNNAFISGVLYAGVCLITGFPFYLTLGKMMKSNAEASWSGIVTGIAFYACVGFVLVILLSNFDSLVNVATGTMFPFPTLAAITTLWPAGAWTYVIIIFIGIFTTTTGYTWVITDWFFPNQERTTKTSLFIVAMMLAGLLLGSVIPFSQLINFMFPLAGIAGVMMTVSIVVKTIKVFGKGGAAIADKE